MLPFEPFRTYHGFMDVTKNNEYTLDELVYSQYKEVKDLIFKPNQLSVYEDYDDFQILIVRRMTIAENSLKFITESFIIIDDQVYHLQKSGAAFSKLKRGNLSLYRLLERFYFENFRIIETYVDEVEKLEGQLFNRNPPAYFMDFWFDVTKALARAQNYYYRSAIVFREFLKKSHKFIQPLEDEFADIDDNIKFQTTNLTTLQERLESLHNYYESIKNDRLNSTLLLLTLISGVFLPLNLIVGFFGMNTEGLFFQGDPQGTLKVVMILVGVLVFCLVGLKIIRMINDYILKFFLGRHDLYKRISKKLEDLDQQLKGK